MNRIIWWAYIGYGALVGALAQAWFLVWWAALGAMVLGIIYTDERSRSLAEEIREVEGRIRETEERLRSGEG